MTTNKQKPNSSPSSGNDTKDEFSDSASPVAGKRETLAARAQRIIGKVLETEPAAAPDNGA